MKYQYFYEMKKTKIKLRENNVKIWNLAQSFLLYCDNLMALVLARFYFPKVLNFGILLLRPLSLQAKQKLVTMGPKIRIQISKQIDFLYLICKALWTFEFSN